MCRLNLRNCRGASNDIPMGFRPYLPPYPLKSADLSITCTSSKAQKLIWGAHVHHLQLDADLTTASHIGASSPGNNPYTRCACKYSTFSPSPRHPRLLCSSWLYAPHGNVSSHGTTMLFLALSPLCLDL